MDKYSGCNIVESVSYTPQKQSTKKGKNSTRRIRSLLLRLAVAFVLIGGICAVAYLPILAPCRDVLKNVFCYDVFGHTDVGTVPIIAKFG